MQLSDFIKTSDVKFGTSGARGLVTNMTPELCMAYTQAFCQAVNTNGPVVIGHDLRPSSPDITRACLTMLDRLGISAIYTGALPTPAIAYYAAQQQLPAMVITGSHIPFDRNGIKFYRADGEISKTDEQAMLTAEIEPQQHPVLLSLPAVCPEAKQAYINRYIDAFGKQALSGMTVAVYEHSSVARDLLHQILNALGATTLSLGRTDQFVPIDTEAVSEKDSAQAQKWAGTHNFDAIISTDGDADRPLIGDEQGQWLRGDIVGILTAHYLKADIVVTPVNSNTALEKSNWFRQIVRTRIGSPYVIADMKPQDPSDNVVGFEANGGFLLGSTVMTEHGRLLPLPTRDAVLPIIVILLRAYQNKQSLSELSRDLPQRVTASDRIQACPTEFSRALIEKLNHEHAMIYQFLAPGAGAVRHIDQTDGLRVTFDNDIIVHLRPSGNAPELRCYVETGNAAEAQQYCQQCLQRITALVQEN